MSEKKKKAVVEATPFEVWSLRFNYTPPPPPVKGPSPEVDGVCLIGAHPYFGSSKRTKARRVARRNYHGHHYPGAGLRGG